MFKFTAAVLAAALAIFGPASTVVARPVQYSEHDARMCPVINVDTELSAVAGQENTYRITFMNHDANKLSPNFVDLHWSTTGHDPINIRIASEMDAPQVEQAGIVVMPGETLRYSATYGVTGVACDTPTYEFTAPMNVNTFSAEQARRLATTGTVYETNAVRRLQQHEAIRQAAVQAQPLGANAIPRACPMIDVEQVVSPVAGQENTYKLTWINHDKNGLLPTFVDLHWQTNERTQTNVRLASDMSSKQVSQDGIVILPGETMRYWSTYNVDGLACDTPIYDFTAPSSNNVMEASIDRYGNVQRSINMQRQPINIRPVGHSEFGVSAARLASTAVTKSEAGACPMLPTEQQLSAVEGLEHTYRLTFINHGDMAGLEPEFVDLHWQVDNNDQVNVRIASDKDVLKKNIQQEGIVILPGQTIRFSSTYRVGHVSCDTATYEYTAPSNDVAEAAVQARAAAAAIPAMNTRRARRVINTVASTDYDISSVSAIAVPIAGSSPMQQQPQSALPIPAAVRAACPVVKFEQKVDHMPHLDNAYQLSFISKTPNVAFDYVDLHYQVNNEPEMNVKLGGGSAQVMDQTGILVAPGSTMRYWFTYQAAGTACDTDKFELITPAAPGVSSSAVPSQQPIQQQPIMQQPRGLMQQPIMQQPIRSNIPSSGVRASNMIETPMAVAGTCPALQFDQTVEKMPGYPNLYTISFINKDSNLDVENVDLHYSIENAPEINVRLGDKLSQQHQKVVKQTGVLLNAGENLRFWFTYQAANGVACDSAHFLATGI